MTAIKVARQKRTRARADATDYLHNFYASCLFIDLIAIDEKALPRRTPSQ